MKLNVRKTALVLGIFFGMVHVVWSLLVLIGFAQPLLDFIFWAHMLANPYRVIGFSLTQSILLIVVTFGVGYVIGYVFAMLWNKMHKA